MPNLPNQQGLTDKELAEREEAAMQAAQAPQEQQPHSTSFGLYCYCDASAAIGGGIGAFMWFGDRAAMLSFLRNHLVFLWPGPSATDPRPVLAAVERIVDALRDPAGDGDAIQQLNKTLRHFSQISWWGSASDLCTSDAAFPREVRAWFRESTRDQEGIDEAIPDREREEFLSALQNYGL